jgi:hypothetical protein
MAKHNPEQEAFKHRDQVNDGKLDETSERLSLEANAVAGNDKIQPKAENFKIEEGSVEKALATLMAGIAEKAARLPQEMREQLVANNADFIRPELLAVVKNPHDFKLTDQQDPKAVMAFLARVQNA